MSDKELEKLRELAERVQCGHRACKALVKAIKRLTEVKSLMNNKTRCLGREKKVSEVRWQDVANGELRSTQPLLRLRQPASASQGWT